MLVGGTVEKQQMADYRLPIFNTMPIKHRSIIAAPLLGQINLTPYLNENIEEVFSGGESGTEAGVCDYD